MASDKFELKAFDLQVPDDDVRCSVLTLGKIEHVRGEFEGKKPRRFAVLKFDSVHHSIDISFASIEAIDQVLSILEMLRREFDHGDECCAR